MVNLELHVAIPMLCMTLFLMLYQMVVSISLYLCVLLSVTLIQLGDDSAMMCEKTTRQQQKQKDPCTSYISFSLLSVLNDPN